MRSAFIFMLVIFIFIQTMFIFIAIRLIFKESQNRIIARPKNSSGTRKKNGLHITAV